MTKFLQATRTWGRQTLKEVERIFWVAFALGILGLAEAAANAAKAFGQ